MKKVKPFNQPKPAPTPKPTDAKPKTSGIKVRGTGAATKGLMARGPMA